MNDERMRILEMISDGTITAEQAAQLIAALDEAGDDVPETFPLEAGPFEAEAEAVRMYAETGAEAEPTPAPQGAEWARSEPEPMPDFRKWRAFWFIPLAIGIGITAISGLLVYAGVRAEWNWFWMSCVWFPLLFGILVILFGLGGRTARWLHLRVNTGEDEWPRRIAISLPLPLRTSAYFMRVFGRFIPGLDDIPIPVDEAILALQNSLSPDDPLYVHVDERDGVKVEVYIG